jgi:hypothetical protein
MDQQLLGRRLSAEPGPLLANSQSAPKPRKKRDDSHASRLRPFSREQIATGGTCVASFDDLVGVQRERSGIVSLRAAG